MKYAIAVFLTLALGSSGFCQTNRLGLRFCVPAILSTPRVTVDTFCTHWHVTVHDSVPLTSATLIDDPDGNVWQPAMAYKNVSFDSKSDPDDKKEVTFNGKDTVVNFDVIVINPFDTAYAPIIIYDKHGIHVIIELRYKSPKASLSTLPVAPPPPVDRINFPVTNINQQKCTTLIYINTAKAGGAPFHINSVKLQKDIDFHITSITPGVPTTLNPGDTLKVQVCFTAKDTIITEDSIITQTDCFEAPLPISGKGGTALIDATDIDFGDVPLGTTSCKHLTISNRGTFPFTLTKDWILHNINEFKTDPASGAALPITIPPGEHVNITICYTPSEINFQDSTSIDWATDVDNKYKNQIKKWSFLKGRGVKPGVIWDRLEQILRIDSTGADSAIVRVWLFNKSNIKTSVTEVSIQGPDAAEFLIVGNQLGFPKLKDFAIDAGDTIWVGLLFKPDLSKPYPIKYFDRIAELVAVYSDESTSSGFDSTVMNLIGTWAKSSVRSEANDILFSIHPNPALGNFIELVLPSSLDEKVTISIHDILGKEVYRNEIAKGIQKTEIPIVGLPNGNYFVKIAGLNYSQTAKIEITR
jgi:hypothetical protein